MNPTAPDERTVPVGRYHVKVAETAHGFQACAGHLAPDGRTWWMASTYRPGRTEQEAIGRAIDEAEEIDRELRRKQDAWLRVADGGLDGCVLEDVVAELRSRSRARLEELDDKHGARVLREAAEHFNARLARIRVDRDCDGPLTPDALETLVDRWRQRVRAALSAIPHLADVDEWRRRRRAALLGVLEEAVGARLPEHRYVGWLTDHDCDDVALVCALAVVARGA